MPMDLDEIEIIGTDTADVHESVKIHGPPGTGKTTQSGARVGRLIRDHGYDVSDVAWATYRRALAHDTLDRFVEWGLLEETELDRPHEGATRYIATMHAIGNRLYDEIPDPADTGDHIDFCDKRDLRYHGRTSWEDGPGEQLFEGFAWLRRNRLDPSDPGDVRQWPGYDDLVESWRGDIGAVWRDWEDYKAQRDLIDYHEMLEWPLKDGYAPPCDVLVVDEYHDATPLMAALAERWIEAAEIVIVAGDPHQVVNNFDGADPRFFQRVDLPGVLLDKTWRVPEEHWRLAVSLLNQAHEPPAVARAGRGRIDEYRSPTFDYDQQRGWTVPDPATPASPAQLVAQLPEDIMFLTRTRMQAAGVCRALDKAGVIYSAQSSVNGGWEPDSARFHLHNALQELRKIDPNDVTTTGGLGSYGNTGGSASIDDVELEPQEAAAILDWAHADHLSASRSDTDEVTAKWRRQLSAVTGRTLKEHVDASFWSTYTAGASSVDRLNTGGLSADDREALKRALQRYSDPVPRDERRVSVLTVHASKGRDAHHVVVYEGTAPRVIEQMRTSERARRNEYRTWYVALTRAKAHLHIMRDGFEWTVPFIPRNIQAIVAQPDDDAATEVSS